jgi:RHS repeat-associated protein
VIGQATVTYTYDAAGNLLSAATPSVGVTFKYDVRNSPTSLTRTNGVVTAYTYDAIGRTLTIVHSKGGAPLNTINYTYDAVGKRSTVANDINQAFITQSAAGTIDNANELKAFGSTSYTSDANGNRLTETSTNGKLTYAWDGRNRLASITDASGNTTSMVYDFKRNLLNLTQNNGGAVAQQSYVVDSRTNIVSLTASTGGAFSVLTGAGVDSHLASVDANGNALFGITDALGSTTSVADGTGKLASKFDYEPYGQMTGTAANGYPFGFTGRVPVLNGINYSRERYYDSATGRFLSEDPIGFAGGANLYAYANGDPILVNDPTGEKGKLGSPIIIKNLCKILNLKKCPVIHPQPSVPVAREGSSSGKGGRSGSGGGGGGGCSSGDSGDDDDDSGDDSADNSDDSADDGSDDGFDFPDDGFGDGSRLLVPPAIWLTIPLDSTVGLNSGTILPLPAAEPAGNVAIMAAMNAGAAVKSRFDVPEETAASNSNEQAWMFVIAEWRATAP